MPIEFACEDCGSVLRVPDGTSGKRSRCPACKHEQEIPFVVDKADAVVPSGKLSIPCPKCQHHLVCDPELLGTRGQCKQCAHIFTISTEPVPVEDSAPALVFHCPQCNQLFEGREEMRGRKGKCHVCQAVFPIKLEPGEGRQAGTPKPDAPKPAASQKAAAPKAAETKKTPAASREQLAAAFDLAAKESTPPSTASTPKRMDTASRPETSKPESRLAPALEPSDVKPDSDLGLNDELTLVEDEPSDRRGRRSTTAVETKPVSVTPKPVAKPETPIRFECEHCQGVMEVPGSTAGLETECPYCQSVLTIPEHSTAVVAPAPAASYSAAPADYGYQNYQAVSAPATAAYGQPMDAGFTNLDLGDASNPYAAPAAAWAAPTMTAIRQTSALTVGNVLQKGFEAMFPSCLVIFLYGLVLGGIGMVAGLLLFGIGYVVGQARPSLEVRIYLSYGLLIVAVVAYVLIIAWMSGALSRTALNAVRKKPFDLAEAMNPGGAFGACILVMGCMLLIMAVAYLPLLINFATGGALAGPAFGMLVVLWFLLIMPVYLLFAFGSCLAIFAGADDLPSTEAIQLSFRLTFRNFGTTIAVLLVSGLIAGVLSLPTLGLSSLVPVYMMASLYNLANK